jgi:hypothetical protein
MVKTRWTQIKRQWEQHQEPRLPELKEVVGKEGAVEEEWSVTTLITTPVPIRTPLQKLPNSVWPQSRTDRTIEYILNWGYPLRIELR